MNKTIKMLISTSPTTKHVRRPHKVVSLALRQRLSYGKPRRNNTGKESDSETGLYYYGARYLDPKTSRWISGDPAVGEYIPSAPVSDEAKKRNGNLPGMGGVFNYVNLHVYHYAGNNPVRYVDPDGRDSITSDTTRERFNEMTSGESDYFSERIWNEAQDYFLEYPNGAYYRAPGELHWQQFENKEDIGLINPDIANVNVLKIILTVRFIKEIARSGWRHFSQFRNVNPNSLTPNALDEFTTIGPSNTALSAARETIRRTGNIGDPILVSRGADGTLTIIDGHHRWFAAIQMGLRKIPIQIIEGL